MQLYCPHCGQQIQADDINLDKELAKCRSCNAVFSFHGVIEDGGRRVRRKPRPAVPQPRGITVEDTGLELRIVRRWFGAAAVFLLFFCVMWDGFLVAWYAMATRAGAPLIMKLVPLLHVAIGAGLTYYTLCLFVNRTVVGVGRELTITHGPLPWPGRRSIDAGDIDQLYVARRIRYSRNGPREWYDLRAVTRDGRRQKLISGLPEPEQALYLEQVIEQRLGLPDRPVEGEFKE